MRESTDPSSAPAPSRAAPTWDDVAYFLAVAREGGLSAAARRLGVEHATVARRVTALETCIGQRLFDRLPRSWQLTDEGAALLGPAERLEQEAAAFARAAQAGNSLHGTVQLSVPPVLGSHFLLPHLAACAQRWAGIELDVVGEARSANLHRREADIALRLMRPHEPGLAARRIGAVNFRPYAAPGWLARPAEEWVFMGYREPLAQVPQQRLLAQRAGDRPFVLRTNDLAALHRACRGGLGIAMLPGFLARGDAALCAVPWAGAAVEREVWCVLHPDVRRSPRVRLMVDLIAEIFATQAID